MLTTMAPSNHFHNKMGVQGSIKGGLKEAKGSAKVCFSDCLVILAVVKAFIIAMFLQGTINEAKRA